jgi:alkylation response protein AidB-like acyl-CoA dehydrogenase
MRQWVETNLSPFASQWDETKKVPRELVKKAAEVGWLPLVVGMPPPKKWLSYTLIADVQPAEADYFHELIVHLELNRCAASGVVWALKLGLNVALPAILLFANDYLQQKVCKSCLSGEKTICLAITEVCSATPLRSAVYWYKHSHTHFIRCTGHGVVLIIAFNSVI